MKNLPHIIFLWKSGKTFYLSLRPKNNPKNSILNAKYQTYSGRWKLMDKLKGKYKAEVVKRNPNK